MLFIENNEKNDFIALDRIFFNDNDIQISRGL